MSLLIRTVSGKTVSILALISLSDNVNGHNFSIGTFFRVF